MGPDIGIGVIIRKDGDILFGKRRNAHGNGAWGFPGGHLEHGESFEDCARREVQEETGLQIEHLAIEAVTNDVFDGGQHYVTVFVSADHAGGTVERREPEKCAEWRWAGPDTCPEPLFLPIRNLLEQGGNLWNP